MSEKKAIRYLSLAAKAGALVTGGDEIEKNIRRGKRGLIITASDAGPSALRRAERLAQENDMSLTDSLYTKSELAAAVGRGSSVAFALVTDRGLASAFLEAAGNGSEQEEKV